jgi:thiamine pyrophosphokinase
MKVVVVASGELFVDDADVLADADLVIAADGGAASLDRLGRRPDQLIGDLDSTDAALVERLTTAGTRVVRHPADKEASDAELALEAAWDAGATEVALLGATGGERLDHELANLLLLADPALASRDVRLMRGRSSVRVVRAGGRLELVGRAGDLVSLLPVGGDAEGVTTEDLLWPLDRATLRLGRSRGLSNEVVGPKPAVSLERGALLVVETPSQGGPT